MQDGKVANAKIKQSFCKYGDEVYRWQKINIGLFSSKGAGIDYSNVERIQIQAKEFTEVPELNGKPVPDAFLLNSEDWGFGVFLIDEKSQRWYEENMAKITHQQNFCEVLGQFIVMMKQVLYPATRIPKILNQCINLKNENLVRTIESALV